MLLCSLSKREKIFKWDFYSLSMTLCCCAVCLKGKKYSNGIFTRFQCWCAVCLKGKNVQMGFLLAFSDIMLLCSLSKREKIFKWDFYSLSVTLCWCAVCLKGKNVQWGFTRFQWHCCWKSKREKMFKRDFYSLSVTLCCLKGGKKFNGDLLAFNDTAAMQSV